MPLGILFGLTAAFIWATASLVVKANAARVDTLSFNAFRVVVGALFFYILLPFFGGAPLLAAMSPLTLLVLTFSVIIGFCIGDSIYFWSMTKIGASRTMPISGIYPVFTWLLAVPLLGEEVTLPAIAGTVLVAGALFLLGRENPEDAARPRSVARTIPRERRDDVQTLNEDGFGLSVRLDAGAGSLPGEDVHSGRVSERTRYLGVAAAVFAALMWACATTLLRLGIQMQEPVTLYDNFQQSVLLGAVRLTIASLVLVPATQLLKGSGVWGVYRTRELPKLAALAIYSTGIGSLVFVLGIALAGAARASLMNAASPLIGVVFSWLFMREHLTRRVWFGTAMALAGVWLVLV